LANPGLLYLNRGFLYEPVAFLDLCFRHVTVLSAAWWLKPEHEAGRKGKKLNMATTQQFTGMRGVYLVAAELSRLGFIVSPTSRSAIGADLLVTDQLCQRAHSLQVKTNAKTFNFWLLNEKARQIASDTHIYVLVNLRKGGKETEFFVVPSRVIAEKMVTSKRQKSTWHSFQLADAEPYRERWDLLGPPA